MYTQKTNYSSTHFTFPHRCADLAWASLEQRAGQPLERGQLPLTEAGCFVGKIFLPSKDRNLCKNIQKWMICKGDCQNCLILTLKLYEKRGSEETWGKESLSWQLSTPVGLKGFARPQYWHATGTFCQGGLEFKKGRLGWMCAVCISLFLVNVRISFIYRY